LRNTVRELDEKVQSMVDRCRSTGMNVTSQRALIYRELLCSQDHPSPEMLLERVKGKLPAISLATIYKTLDMLLELKLAFEIPAIGNHKRYDANMHPHHHLLCTSCGFVGDTDEDVFFQISLPKGIDGFLPKGYSVNVHGLCSRCRNPSRKEKES
jgi:Fur family peroxide stress response transcriptional regulator